MPPLAVEVSPNTPGERLGRVESSVDGLHSEVRDIRASVLRIEDNFARSLGALQATVLKSEETNWSVVIAGVALVVGVYAAAIRPLQNDINRQEQTAGRIADAVLLQNQKVVDLQVAEARQNNDIASAIKDINHFAEHGSPDADKRLHAQ